MISLEAFARRTPVLARDIGPLPEVIHESGGGLLFRDDAELLAAVRRLAGDRRLRDELGSRGYEPSSPSGPARPTWKRYFDLITRTASRKFGEIPWSDGVRDTRRRSWRRPSRERSRDADHPASRVPVLMYHSISDGPGPTCIAPETFRRQMAILEETGYRVVSLMELLGWMQRRARAAGPLRRPDLRRRLRRLRHGRFPGIATARLARDGVLAGRPRRRLRPLGGRVAGSAAPRRLMDWPTIAELAAARGRFRRPRRRRTATSRESGAMALEAEVLDSKRAIEDRTGRAGHQLRRPVRPIRRGGRRRGPPALPTWPSGPTLARAGRESDHYDIPRIEMWYFRQPRRWRAFLRGEAENFLLARRLLRRVRGLAAAISFSPAQGRGP